MADFVGDHFMRRFVAYFRFFEWKNLYYPSREIEATPSVFGLRYEDVNFISEDGRMLHGWWSSAPASARNGHPLSW